MATFKSDIRKIDTLSIPPPIIAIEITTMGTVGFICPIKVEIIIPYPPNFSNTPAKIIEPETGASTCALGNQRWER